MTRGTPFTIALVALAVGLLGVQVAQRVRPLGGDAPVRPTTPAATQGLRLGVTTAALARNAGDPWRSRDLVEVDRFEAAIGRRTNVVSWFADLSGRGVFTAAQGEAVARRGAIPEITLEPWVATNARPHQPAWALRTITAGRHDAALRRWARALAAYDGPVRLRFAHEMNGSWYPWAIGLNGNTAADYVAAWIHVHRLFDAAGARNVQWVWAPVAGAVPVAAFPGTRWVDRLGLSGFNGGSRLFKREWRTFGAAFARPLDDLHALAPRLPVGLAEIASAERGGSKAEWIGELFEGVRARPWIDTLTWFELRKETDWRVVSSPASQRAFRAEAARLP